jgi:tetratricopeptide (TPR) repeat protein
MRDILLIAIGVTLAACAGQARPAPAPADVPVHLSRADALVGAGCYTCLLEAFATYERALASRVPPTDAREKAFATAVLLAMREKELGLEAVPWLERASRLATPDETPYLDLVSRLPWTSAGVALDFDPPRPATPTEVAEWRLRVSPAHAILNDYISVAAACSLGTGLEAAARVVDLGVPAVRYRAGLCDRRQRRYLEEVVAADPRFVEAWFFIGRYEMSLGVSPIDGRFDASTREWLTSAVPPLSAAHDGLPDAPVVSVVFAGLMRARGELARALALYDEALALRPAQGDALLGRTVTLTYLKQHEEAVSTASRLIALGVWHVGDAYYWRAWNEYQRGALEAAAADIAAARRLQTNADVMLVSGMIAYDQQRPADARMDFERSLRMDSGKCPARWYLGFLNIDEERWPEAVSSFAAAGDCYVAAVSALRAELDALPPDLPAEARQQQTDSYDQNIADSVGQAGRSFFNAAQASVRTGDLTSATAYARSAAAYEGVRDRAEGLLKDLEER